jgi:hypothetical protein
MAKKNAQIIIPDEVVMDKIYLIRGKKVMLDRDLAQLYNVETKALKQAVRRNVERFPDDFMFELNKEEFTNLRSQFVTSSWGGARYKPMAFTEQGVAMLSSVLYSKQAVLVNIQIIRVFTKMRELILTHKDLLLKMEQLEKKVASQDQKIALVFKYLKKFIDVQDKPREQIGYKQKGQQ